MLITWLVLLPGILLSGCGINNIPTFEDLVNRAWNDLQTHYQSRAKLALELQTLLPPVLTTESPIVQRMDLAAEAVAQTDVSPTTLVDSNSFSAFEKNQNELSAAVVAVATAVQIRLDALTDEAEIAATERGRLTTLLVQLEEVQLRIDVARRDYVQKVERYNKELNNIPGRWWRSFMYRSATPRESFTPLPPSPSADDAPSDSIIRQPDTASDEAS